MFFAEWAMRDGETLDLISIGGHASGRLRAKEDASTRPLVPSDNATRMPGTVRATWDWSGHMKRYANTEASSKSCTGTSSHTVSDQPVSSTARLMPRDSAARSDTRPRPVNGSTQRSKPLGTRPRQVGGSRRRRIQSRRQSRATNRCSPHGYSPGSAIPGSGTFVLLKSSSGSQPCTTRAYQRRGSSKPIASSLPPLPPSSEVR